MAHGSCFTDSWFGHDAPLVIHSKAGASPICDEHVVAAPTQRLRSDQRNEAIRGLSIRDTARSADSLSRRDLPERAVGAARYNRKPVDGTAPATTGGISKHEHRTEWSIASLDPHGVDHRVAGAGEQGDEREHDDQRGWSVETGDLSHSNPPGRRAVCAAIHATLTRGVRGTPQPGTLNALLSDVARMNVSQHVGARRVR